LIPPRQQATRKYRACWRRARTSVPR
jgi:hypothetical protein